MKKHSEVVVHSPRTGLPEKFELHTEKPKGKKQELWYVFSTGEKAENLTKDNPFEKRPTMQEVFKAVGY